MRQRNRKRIVVALWLCCLIVITVHFAIETHFVVTATDKSGHQQKRDVPDPAFDTAKKEKQPVVLYNPNLPLRFHIEAEIATQKAFEAKELELMQSLAAEHKAPFFRYFLINKAAGFASQLNNGLNGILMARQMGIPFQFVVNDNWQFVSWEAHFDDFSSGVSDVDYRMFAKEGSRNCTSEEVLVDTNSLREAEEEICTGHSVNENWIVFRRLMEGMVNTNTTLKQVFLAKRRYTQAIWRLKPTLQQLVDDIVNKVFNADAVNPPLLVGLHLRRGDKIGPESADIPVHDFVSKVVSLPGIRKHNKTLVFAFSDDDQAIASFELELQSMATSEGFTKGSFEVVTLSSLLARVSPDYHTQAHTGYQHFEFHDADPQFRVAYTRDLVLTLSLNRYVDYFVGTFSSNIGRLAALLRYDSILEHNYSLDIREWFHD